MPILLRHVAVLVICPIMHAPLPQLEKYCYPQCRKVPCSTGKSRSMKKSRNNHEAVSSHGGGARTGKNQFYIPSMRLVICGRWGWPCHGLTDWYMNARRMLVPPMISICGSTLRSHQMPYVLNNVRFWHRKHQRVEMLHERQHITCVTSPSPLFYLAAARAHRRPVHGTPAA
jgi:hypothetical protein